MPRRDPGRDIELARSAWQVLAAQAALQATITYGQLHREIEWRGANQGSGRILNLVADYCQDKSLPDITILVVLKKTGRPSKITVNDVDMEQKRVFGQNWSEVPPPSAEALREFL